MALVDLANPEVLECLGLASSSGPLPGKLLSARMSAGASLADVAASTSISEAELSSWESGFGRPELVQLMSLIQFYGSTSGDAAALVVCFSEPDPIAKVLDMYKRAAKRVEARIAKALCLDQCEPKEYTLSLDLPHAKRAAFSFGIGAVSEVLEVKNGDCVLDPGDYFKRRGRLWLCCGEWSACGCPSVVVKVIAGLDATDETLMQIVIDAVGAEACALDPRIKSERSSLRNYTLFAPAELGYPPGFTEDLWHCVQDMRVTQNPGLRLQPHC